MSDPTRSRINAAFDQELAGAPVPAGLRTVAIRSAVSARRGRRQPAPLIALVAAIVAVAIVATLAIGTHRLTSTPVPAKPGGSVVPPSPRSGADLVYDAAHHQLVLFGGSMVGGLVNETWTWDGHLWRLQHPRQSPAARRDGVMAYDQAHRDVILFGGQAQLKPGKGGLSPVTDTWVWDGSSWAERHPQHEPAVAFDWPASMIFDPLGKTVLLYAFNRTSTQGANLLSETWSWNGADWSQLALSTTPTQTGEMVSDEANTYLIASPTATRVGGRYLTQMWKWDGGAWKPIAPGNNMVAGTGAMAYDPHRGKIVALIGAYTWTWDGSRWTREHPQTQPPVGYVAYFGELGEVVTFGDRSSGGTNAMWAWTGTDWKQIGQGVIAPPPTPSGRFGPMSPDAAATFIRQHVPSPTQVLLPTWLPAGMQATVDITADGFNVDYVTDQFDKDITLGIVAANPPPGDSSSSDTTVSFRGGTAEYFVYDARAPLSNRWLLWSIGGSLKTGTPYFMSASGLTDAEFWQVAGSLQ